MKKLLEKNFLLYFFISLFVIILAVSVVSKIVCYNSGQAKVCFENNCFDVELARTSQEKAQGLMFRKSLDSDKGMLFIFEQEGEYNFWMKNTLIPLDIIWIDKDKKVVWVKKSTQSCLERECQSFGSDQKAKYILELNAGTVDRINLEIGDELIFDKI